jgi:cytochrome P450
LTLIMPPLLVLTQAVRRLPPLGLSTTKERRQPSQDLLSKLQKGKDEAGLPMGRDELTAEALTQLIAGSGAFSACPFPTWLRAYSFS